MKTIKITFLMTWKQDFDTQIFKLKTSLQKKKK